MIQGYTIRFAAFGVLISLILVGCRKPSGTSAESNTPTKNSNAAGTKEKPRITSLPPGEKLTPLTDGQVWVSEDGTYTALIPRNWIMQTFPLADDPVWRAPDVRNMYMSITHSNDAQAATPEEESIRLLGETLSHSPPTLGAEDYKTLEEHTGEIGGFPAAWRITAFKDPSIGQVNRLAVAIGTPTAVYSITAMARGSDFDKLRPTLEGIAGSFKVK